MAIGQKLRQLREARKLSQSDIQKRVGLLRNYVSRIECGHIIPGVETLEKYARVLEIPMYQLFYEGDSPEKLKLPASDQADKWGFTPSESAEFQAFVRLLARMNDRDRDILLSMAQRLARRKSVRRRVHADN
jgi:transcriptional regulator with XRE-family HTH domain